MCTGSVLCVYFGFPAELFLIFPYQTYHRTFLASCGSNVRPNRTRPNRTGPDRTRAAAGSDGCARSIYCTVCPILPSCLFVFRFVFCFFFLPLTLTTERHSCSDALLSRRLSAGRRGGALLIGEGGGTVSLACGGRGNNFWQAEPAGREPGGWACPRPPSSPPLLPSTHAASLVICMPYVLHIVYIFI